MMNRKLIRTTLAQVKEREMQQQQARQMAPPPPPPQPRPQFHSGGGGGGQAHQQQPKKKVPPEQTNAESFYYKKQMDSHTPMVVVLQDGETLYGSIEWYDKCSLKLHREGEPNLLILKHNIKYLYKDPEVGEDD
jgi:sRNA-binding regulator protein Hfq